MEAWTATKQAEGSWLFEWDGESAETFYIWLDGELLVTVEGGEYNALVEGYDDAPPPLEIVSDESGVFAENELYPPFIILQWREVDGAHGYSVEVKVGANWIFVVDIIDASAGYYWYKTLVLDDDTEYQYRINAVDVNGNAGTPVNFTFTIARNPAPPSVALSMVGGDLVVEAA